MPIFDYCCIKCGHVFEQLILSSDHPEAGCPRCGSRQVERMISAPVIHNTASKNGLLHQEYTGYRKRWKENAYMPKPKKKTKD
jgi:putative FmdB family regulatory protein